MAQIIKLQDNDTSLYPVTRTAAVYDSNNQALDVVLINKENKHSTAIITLSESSWTNGSQTVSVDGVTDDNTIFVAPTQDSRAEYDNSAIYCALQAPDSLTFKCTTVPTSALTVNIVIFNG